MDKNYKNVNKYFFVLIIMLMLCVSLMVAMPVRAEENNELFITYEGNVKTIGNIENYVSSDGVMDRSGVSKKTELLRIIGYSDQAISDMSYEMSNNFVNAKKIYTIMSINDGIDEQEGIKGAAIINPPVEIEKNMPKSDLQFWMKEG